MSQQSFVDRIQSLRAAMRDAKVDAYVALSSDPHLSEYLPDHWQGRRWLSGFDGSAGTLVVTQDFAGLWTDSRYWEQAENDLDGTGILTMRAGGPDVPGPAQWLAEELTTGNRVNIDGNVLSVQSQRHWHDTLSSKGIKLVLDTDVLAVVWRDRAPLPGQAVFEHLPPFACRTRAENLAAVRSAMREHGAQWHVLSSLDDIAWLFNLRGKDVSYNPVFLSYALIAEDHAALFVATEKISRELQESLAADGVRVAPYEDIAGALSCLPEQDVLLLDPARTTYGLLRAAAFVSKTEALAPSQLLKSRKTDAELANVRAVMEEDGAALCEFFSWFEQAQGREAITELTIDEKITAARSRRGGFVSPSFGTIAAYAANGAMPHYHATEDAHAIIEGNGLLLIDSGGQYLGGTTDITRVVPVGEVNAQQKRDYTAVLQGMIALSLAVFPEGLSAALLDPLARAPIWRTGAEYGHGTGHGVGYFMNVHEGPQSISYRAAITPPSSMLPGMITSNEPGLYRPGKWGIRIENLILTVPACETEFGRFLRFETLTLCPIDTRCIEVDMLAPHERDWLNNYHLEVRARLAPLVSGIALEWLMLRAEPV